MTLPCTWFYCVHARERWGKLRSSLSHSWPMPGCLSPLAQWGYSPPGLEKAPHSPHTKYPWVAPTGDSSLWIPHSFTKGEEENSSRGQYQGWLAASTKRMQIMKQNETHSVDICDSPRRQEYYWWRRHTCKRGFTATPGLLGHRDEKTEMWVEFPLMLSPHSFTASDRKLGGTWERGYIIAKSCSQKVIPRLFLLQTVWIWGFSNRHIYSCRNQLRSLLCHLPGWEVLVAQPFPMRGPFQFACGGGWRQQGQT